MDLTPKKNAWQWQVERKWKKHKLWRNKPSTSSKPTPDFVCYRSHSLLVPLIPGRLHEAWPLMLWKRPSATHARWGNAAWHKTPVSTSLRLMVGQNINQDQKVVNLSRQNHKTLGKTERILFDNIQKNTVDMDAKTYPTKLQFSTSPVLSRRPTTGYHRLPTFSRTYKIQVIISQRIFHHKSRPPIPPRRKHRTLCQTCSAVYMLKT